MELLLLFISSILLLLTGLFDFQVGYGFYVFLRWFVTLSTLIFAYQVYKTKSESYLMGICLFSIVFNPITPIYMSKEIWHFVDVLAGIIFLFALVSYYELKEKHHNKKVEYIKTNLESNKNETINKDEDVEDYSYKFEDNKRKCDICGSTENVTYYPTSGYIEENKTKTYLSGGVNICKSCLEKCEICATCGKLLPTEEIKKYIGHRMNHPDFCENLFAHERINKLKEKYNL